MAAFYKWRMQQNFRKLMALGSYHIAMIGAYWLFSGKFGDSEEDREEFTQTVLNPYSTEFLKVRRGQRVFSVSPFVSYYRYMARLATQPLINGGLLEDTFDRSKAMQKKTGLWDHTSDFLKYRLNPFVGAVEAGVWNRDWDGSKISPHSVWSDHWLSAVGDRTGALAKKSLAPIWAQGAIDNISRKTYLQIPGEMFIDFVGINSYTVEAYQDVKVKKYLEGKKF